MKTRILVCTLLVLSLTCVSSAQLSGNYTIDPAGSGSNNYTTWAAAVSALGAGVSGNVVFTVASTTFNEAVTINPITGTSASAHGHLPGRGYASGPGCRCRVGWPGPQHHVQLPDLRQHRGQELHAVRSEPGRRFLHPGDLLHIQELASSTHPCPRRPRSAPRTSTTRMTAPSSDCVFAGGGRCFYTQQINRCFTRRCEFDGKGSASQLLSPWNSNDSDNLYENCFFHDCGATGYAFTTTTASTETCSGTIRWWSTTSNAAVFMGSCCAWTRANSFRNNIVVNMGTGSAMIYGFNGTVLDYNDLDYNCYYAPNTTTGTVRDERSTFTGTLGRMEDLLRGQPVASSPAGGGTSWDQNSIEMNLGPDKHGRALRHPPHGRFAVRGRRYHHLHRRLLDFLQSFLCGPRRLRG